MSSPTPNRPSADRNLLFGVLAMQMDFITRDALVAAMNAWMLDKAKPLGEILVEHGFLRLDRRAALEALVDMHLDCHQGDSEKSLAALTVPVPLRQELQSLGDAELQTIVALLPNVTLPTTNYASPHTGATGLRYHVLRPHAKGGLGEVFVALDQELQREVALKEIDAELADDPQSRGRFVREAEITGGLEHPGIVPVYGLGQHGDGRPFYAMRFIQGETLKDAIARFHRPSGVASAPGRLGAPDELGAQTRPRSPEFELRALLTRFVAVCNAMAYAHSRGVIHRDLKPSNIMLGKYGETLVVDWGLAKAIGSVRARSVIPGLDEPSLKPQLSDGTAETQVGAALGTPAYMSPEQAAGRLDLLGMASDIYSLGATLYTLLTGRAPVEGKDTAQILRQVQAGDWRPPRHEKPHVPRALDAICCKAMALKPEQRYASALELGGDVERWLGDEPITAWREPVGQRARRWLRRHGVAAAGAAAAAVVALLSLSVGLTVLQAKNTELGRAKNLADERSRQTRKAVDEYFTEVSESPRLLRKEPGTQEIRRTLLERARRYYENFLAEGGDDPGLRAEAAAAYFRLAGITRELSAAPAALALYEKALAIQEGLVSESPENPDRAAELATTYSTMGTLYRATGKSDAAREFHAKALAIRERLVRAEPGRSDFAHGLARTHLDLAVVHYTSREYSQAMEVTAKARTILEPLVRDNPLETQYARDLAKAHMTVGNLLSEENNKYAEALAAYESAAGIFEQLVAKNPAEPDYALGLTYVYNNIGNLQDERHLYEESLKTHAKSLAVRERLVRENPGVVDYARHLAGTYTTLGHLYYRTEQPEKSRGYHEKARAILEKLVKDNPSMTDFAADLGRTYWNMGQLLRDNGQPEEALDWYGKSIETLRGMLQRAGKDLWTEEFLRSAYWGRARALLKLKRDEEADEDWQQAFKLDTSQAGERTRVERAYGLAGANRYAAAAKEAEALATTAPVTPNALYSAAGVYGRCATAASKDTELPAARQTELAESFATRAVELLALAHAAGHTKDPEFVRQLHADKDFALLRPRADFEKLLRAIAAKP